jgi:hypothetical protein
VKLLSLTLKALSLPEGKAALLSALSRTDEDEDERDASGPAGGAGGGPTVTRSPRVGSACVQSPLHALVVMLRLGSPRCVLVASRVLAEVLGGKPRATGSSATSSTSVHMLLAHLDDFADVAITLPHSLGDGVTGALGCSAVCIVVIFEWIVFLDAVSAPHYVINHLVSSSYTSHLRCRSWGIVSLACCYKLLAKT